MSACFEQIVIITPEFDHPSFPAFLAKPERGGPGLILITENLDITQEVEQEAIILSQEGYIVLVPDLSEISPDDQEEVVFAYGMVNHLE
ncbi:16515_t:CDS:1, partial [Acaulospora colombiana]